MKTHPTCKHCGELMNEPNGEHRCGQPVKTVNAIAESTPPIVTIEEPKTETVEMTPFEKAIDAASNVITERVQLEDAPEDAATAEDTATEDDDIFGDSDDANDVPDSE